MSDEATFDAYQARIDAGGGLTAKEWNHWADLLIKEIKMTETTEAEPMITMRLSEWLRMDGEIKRLRAGWQPIETAPKDGTPVLLYFEGWDMCAAQYLELTSGDYHNGWWDADGLDFGYGASNPTHWMPLPEPPDGP